MKFSVLLPTRDRLEYLKQAVDTVQRQGYDDWEIIVSDNESSSDVAGYVDRLKEPRIRYFRTDRLLPVTENWNKALNESTGDYVIMLGDDDGLRKGYFQTAKILIDEFQQPDAIYTGAYIFAYPGVMPGSPDGFLKPDINEFMHGDQPFWISETTATQLVRGALNFRMLYAFNMQYSLISRSFIESLRDKGPFFQSPYPDFYATNAMFLKAKRILVLPKPATIIGITPRSYGFFHFNNREGEGAEFLQNLPDDDARQRLDGILLPGTRNNTCWLFAMETLRQRFQNDLPYKVNYRRYRFLQAGHVYKHYYIDKTRTRDTLRQLRAGLSTVERVLYDTVLGIPAAAVGMLPPKFRAMPLEIVRRLVGQHRHGTVASTGAYANLTQVFDGLSPLGR